MDNAKVYCGFIIFLQIADLPREAAYNFSLCRHEDIRDDLLNAFDEHMTISEGPLLDYHTCEDTSAGPQLSEDARRAQQESRLLECVLDGARGCGELWLRTVSVVRRRCRGYRTPQERRWRRRDEVRCDERKVQELMAMWRSYMNLE